MLNYLGMSAMKKLLVFTITLSLAAGAGSLFAQGGSTAAGGAIAGTVVDSIGDPVDNAPVQAKSVASGGVFKAVSSKTGKYSLADLPPGAYDVSTAVPGLMPFERKGVEVKPSETATLDIRFKDTTQLNTLGEDRTHQIADLKRHFNDTSPTPRTADGHPDLSGVWWRPNVVDPGKPEFLPSAVAITKQRLDKNNQDSPQARCLPSGPLRYGPLWEFVQSKSFLVYISDDESPGFHQIYLDGRGHPADPNPAWYGHNIARWDGDTLVIDRVAFDDRVWLDLQSHPHSDKLHIVERYRRPDMGHIEIETTVDDPGVLAKPWTVKSTADLAHEEIFEFICTENNRDLEHFIGK
jgi:hypothetical protein